MNQANQPMTLDEIERVIQDEIEGKYLSPLSNLRTRKAEFLPEQEETLGLGIRQQIGRYVYRYL